MQTKEEKKNLKNSSVIPFLASYQSTSGVTWNRQTLIN
jgi:hypothetical protein